MCLWELVTVLLRILILSPTGIYGSVSLLFSLFLLGSWFPIPFLSPLGSLQFLLLCYHCTSTSGPSSPTQPRFNFLPLTLSPCMGPFWLAKLLSLSPVLHELLRALFLFPPTSSAWHFFFFLYLICLSNSNTSVKLEPRKSLSWLPKTLSFPISALYYLSVISLNIPMSMSAPSGQDHISLISVSPVLSMVPSS